MGEEGVPRASSEGGRPWLLLLCCRSIWKCRSVLVPLRWSWMIFLHCFPSKCLSTNPNIHTARDDDLDFTGFIGNRIPHKFTLWAIFLFSYFSLNSLVHIYGCKLLKLPLTNLNFNCYHMYFKYFKYFKFLKLALLEFFELTQVLYSFISYKTAAVIKQRN